MTGGTQRAVARLPTTVRVLLMIAAVMLAAAAAFGLWHLVVAGLLNGNPRAATFGAVLALAAGLPLLLGIWIVGRRHPPAG